MKIDVKTAAQNAAHVNGQIRKQAEVEFEDPSLAQTAFRERMRRADASLHAVQSSLVANDEVISFELKINSASGVAGATYRKKPTAEALLVMLGMNCIAGDQVTATTSYTNGKVEIEALWPVSISVANEMVSGIKKASAKPVAKVSAIQRRLGPLGAVELGTQKGAPSAKRLQVKTRLERKNGSVGVGVTLGWRRRSVYLAWAKAKA